MSLPPFCLDEDVVLKDLPPEIRWRTTIPNYDKAKLLFQKSKSKDHPNQSLERVVQNLVKNWEKEASHKVDANQWLTIDVDAYRFSCNGQEKYLAEEMISQGTYNVLIGQTNYYDGKATGFDESHSMFKKCLGEGFAWEVLEVYSPPPQVTFKWRHFGRMTDSFSGRSLSGHLYEVPPTNKLIELFGMCKATINSQFQIQDLQVFYDPNQLFAQLTEISPFAPFEHNLPGSSSSSSKPKGAAMKPKNAPGKVQTQKGSDLISKDRMIELHPAGNFPSKMCAIS